MALSKTEKNDRRNARYADAHKDDVLSKHGLMVRNYYRRHNREMRLAIRAKRQAIADIRNYLMTTYKWTIIEVNKAMQNMFYNDI